MTQLARLLTGKARAAYTSLRTEDAADYDLVKQAIFQRYEVNEETHRRRFRLDRKKDGEFYLGRLRDYFDGWIKDAKVPIEELMLLEQFLQCVPEDLAVWIKEKKPESLKQAAQLADDYMTARNQKVVTQRNGSTRQSVIYSKIPRKKTTTNPERPRTNTRGEKQCFHCKQ